MSYRSIKRVLGETHLERKCRFLFGACLLLLITGSFWIYGWQTEKLVYKQNQGAAQGLVDAVLAVVHWKVFETNENFRPMVDLLVEKMRNQQYQWRIIKPTSPSGLGRPQDEFESRILTQWRMKGLLGDEEKETAKKVPDFEWRTDQEKNEFQYYRPIFANEQCVACHRANQRPSGEVQLGDLLGVVQVTLSNDEVVKEQAKNKAWLLTNAIVTVFLAMIALYVIVRYVIVKPLKHLRDVSDEISRGNIDLRADIQTGDEFQELADTFNRMMRHLVGAQQELTLVNTSLDTKVDQLAQANMRLYEMNRLKGDFLATVSHELRTPLNSIIGFSDILDNASKLSDKEKRYVSNIQRSGRMLLEMINDILDLAKIESGKMDVRPEEFRIDTLAGAQCDMARPLAEKKNIDLICRVASSLPPLVQDQHKVQQILNNLLSNAIKFTPEGGRITVAADRDAGGDLILVVSDTGVGIADEEKSVVFEKFRQGSNVLASGDVMIREHSGTGLGLSIVKELCRLLGGEVMLESELGKGSTFTIRLPWTLGDTNVREGVERDSYDAITRA